MFKSKKKLETEAYQYWKEVYQKTLEKQKINADNWEKSAVLSENKLKAVYNYCHYSDIIHLYDTILENYDDGSFTYSDLIYISKIEDILDEFGILTRRHYELCLKVIGCSGERNFKNSIEFYITFPLRKLHISDIECEPSNGYGTKMMLILLDFAQSQNVETITGNLCRTDLNDHGDRLLHFYTKFDFKIIDTPERIKFPKKIIKTLNKM